MYLTSTLEPHPSPTPLLPPPPGVTPNFVNPVSRAPAVHAANAAVTVVMLLFVLARLFAKFAYARSQLGWDDVCCVMGTISSLAYMGLVTWLFHNGLGLHAWDTRLDVFLEKMRMLTMGTKAIKVLYGVAMIFTKFSILFLFFRLFQVSRRASIWIHIGIFSTLLTHVIGSILCITAGTPTDPDSDARYVNRLNVIQLSLSAANVAGDCYVLLLPIIEVSRLQLDQRRKLGVLAVFSTGLLSFFPPAGWI
ncbi:MAG: hypothetical protein Q9225_002023 [Loekoesia sp. 1 TL-2023]